MRLRSYSPVLLGFVTAVLVLQNLAVGYCSSQGTLFFVNCPASEAGECESCRCEKSCNGESGDCCRFLSLELDEFPEGAPLSALPEVPSTTLGTVVFWDSSIQFPRGEVIRMAPSRDGPPPGIPLFLRFSVALI